ncbi:protein of unknown function [Sphingobacterium nematocida]|uniref:DUF4783 domain-containing protein n=1 Tax=Sphingobacterium nematocida TaxID=1513896 RepID=A0A1T5FMW7_9SPHI|nr:DUF4783 domain-containing protein [Sphingobacterium nematocida]SKB97510.1 protein of unknown function [Sphingobacterium nematocida]
MTRNLIFLATSFIFLLSSFQITDISNNISQGLKANNAKAIAKYFSSSISLSIDKEEQVVTRFQGELLLADFFRQYKVTEVKRLTASGGNQSNRYFIYNVKTAKRNFRVLVKVIELKGAASISELRIE